MRNEKEMNNEKWETGKKWERNEKWMGRHKKTASQERPSALDNKNLNSYYRSIEIILIISEVKEVKGVIAPYGRWGVKTIVFLA